ncbi:MAG: MlaD family protein, partial [Pseudomonadota bacterium]
MTSGDMPTANIEPRRKRSVSPVWIVPILAALIGAAVAWQSYADRGILVEVHFEKGQGLKAEKTEVKHKGVVVGLVEDVTLTDDLKSVIASVRLDRVVGPYLGAETDFWIVSANVSGTSLSGLGTLLSGAYIEVDWPGEALERRRSFEGLDTAPLTPPGVEGRRVDLYSNAAGGLNVGSPVFFKKIKVGRVESRALSEDFERVEYQAFVDAPYDRLLGNATKFWNVSGVSVDAGANGLQVNMASMESLLAGGIAFGDLGIDIGDAPLSKTQAFRIYPDRAAALESQFDADEEQSIFLTARFADSIRGLEKGAPVEWQGIRVGTVDDIRLELPEVTALEDDISVYAVLALQPSRIGLENVTEEQSRFGLNAWVESGMRAQLATGNILTGKKLVRFIDAAAPPGEGIDFTTAPFPTLPTVSSGFDALTQNLEQVAANIAELPLDDLVASAVTLLSDADALIANPEMKRVPGELVALLESVQGAALNVETMSNELPTLVENLNQLASIADGALAGVAPDSELYVELSGAISELRDAGQLIEVL